MSSPSMPILHWDDAAKGEIEAAENQWRRGQYSNAYVQYRDLLRRRLVIFQHAAQVSLESLDVLVLDRNATLAALVGSYGEADLQLELLHTAFIEVQNDYSGAFVALKRVRLALDFDNVAHAVQLLEDILSITGDINEIDFTKQGLIDWEQTLSWMDFGENQEQTVFLAHLYWCFGSVLAAQGQYPIALTALRRGLAHCLRDFEGQTQEVFLPLKLAITGVYLEQGALDKAAKSLRNLSPLLQPGRYLNHYLYHLELSARLNLLRGQYGLVLEQSWLLHRLTEAHNLTQLRVRSALNLAQVLIYLNQTQRARELLSALELQESVHRDESAMVRCGLLLQDAAQRANDNVIFIVPSVMQQVQGNSHSGPSTLTTQISGQENTARNLNFIETAHQTTSQPTNYLAFFEERSNRFYREINAQSSVKSQLKNWEIARQELEALQQVFGNSQSLLIRLHLFVMENILYYCQGEYLQVESALRAICPILRKLQLNPQLWQVLTLRVECRHRIQSAPMYSKHLEVQATKLRLKVTKSLTSADQAMYVLDHWQEEEEELATEVEAIQKLQEKPLNADYRAQHRRRCALSQRLYSLLQQIDRYKRISSVPDAKSENVGNVGNVGVGANNSCPLWKYLRHLPENRLRISFLVLPDRIVVIRASRHGLDFFVTSTGRKELLELRGKWFQALHILRGGRHVGKGDHETDGDAIEDLHPEAMGKALEEAKTLAKHLAEALGTQSWLNTIPVQIQALTIVPDDSLHGLPFGALRYQNQFLVERFCLSFAFASVDIQEGSPSRQNTDIHALAETPTAPRKQHALVVGVSQGTTDIPPLPGVAKEIKAVQAWLEGHGYSVQKLFDETATRQTFLDHLSAATFLHIACHGFFDTNQPGNSGLIFVPRPSFYETVKLRDIARCTLSHLEHVTLSSCWSADSYVVPGRWIIGLPEILWRNGTQSILSCIWQVDDAHAVNFIHRFYELLEPPSTDSSLRRERALQQTQVECLNGLLPDAQPNANHPFFWAGYALYS